MEMTYYSAPPRVFLSFAMEHKSLVDLFRYQAHEGFPGLVFRDYSIKEPVEGGVEDSCGASHSSIKCDDLFGW